MRELRLRNIAWGCFISPQPWLHTLCFPLLSLFLNHSSFPILFYLCLSLPLCLSETNPSLFSRCSFLPSPRQFFIIFFFQTCPSFWLFTFPFTSQFISVLFFFPLPCLSWRECKQVTLCFLGLPSPLSARQNLAEEAAQGMERTWHGGGVQMTSPFIGEFCEVRELLKGRQREMGREGGGTPAGVQDVFVFFEEKQLRDGTRGTSPHRLAVLQAPRMS